MLKILKKFIFILFGIALIYFVSKQLYIVFSTKGIPMDVSFVALSIGTILYFISHFMRSIRLLILASDPNISLRSLIKAQYVVNGVNLLLPFRLGEAYRVIRFIEFFKTGYRSFLFLLIERIFDFSIILLFLLSLQVFYKSIEFSSLFGSAIIWFGLLFFLGLFLLLFVVDDFLEIMQRHIIQRYTSNKSNLILKFIFHTRNLIKEISLILKKKWFSCAIMTLIIWGLEILVFASFYNITNSVDSILYLAIFVFLSSLLPSGPLGYGGVQLAFYYVGQNWNIEDFIGYSIWYNIFIFLPAISLSFILFINSIRKIKNEDSN